MFLKALGADDPRFKTLHFHNGLNLVLAEKAEGASQTDSRNGAGKSSVIRLLRYLFGGSRTPWIKGLTSYSDGDFWADVVLGDGATHRIRRSSVSPEVTFDNTVMSITEWQHRAGEDLLGFPAKHSKPTSGEVFSQLIRDYFGNPTKGNAVESDQSTGARIGYFLGLSEEALSKSAKAASFDANKKALKKAVREGILGEIGPTEVECKSDLVVYKKRQAELRNQLSNFKIDQSYAYHQTEANHLSKEICKLNDRGVSLRTRLRELKLALSEEDGSLDRYSDIARLKRLYVEAGIVFQDHVLATFQDVIEFHQSVSRNRRLFLEETLSNINKQLAHNDKKIQELDAKRSRVLALLKSSMALDVFLKAQEDLADINEKISWLETRIRDFGRLKDMDSTLKQMQAKAEDSVHKELKENSFAVHEAITLFDSLCREIYTDRHAELLFDVTNKGVLKVTPRIEGDASKGINEVATFLFDLICVIIGKRVCRIPGFLVHDSHLFDAMDDRQLASCLSIGARLSREYDIQYIILINTDRLEAAESAGFDRKEYALSTLLTDKGESGGLFGCRFG